MSTESLSPTADAVDTFPLIVAQQRELIAHWEQMDRIANLSAHNPRRQEAVMRASQNMAALIENLQQAAEA